MSVAKNILVGGVVSLLGFAMTQSGVAATLPEGETIDCQANPMVRGVEGTSLKKVQITADEIAFPERSVVQLSGYTQLIRGGYRVYADELIYRKQDEMVEARGLVTFETPEGDVIRTSKLEYDVKTGKAVSGPATFLLADRKSTFLGEGNAMVNAFGDAQKIEFEDENLLKLHDAEVTSCLNGEKDITFTAADLNIDMDEGVRTAERAKVKIAAPKKHKRYREIID